MTVTGFLHPGAMGSTIAATCSGDTLWVSEGRSAATRERADAGGLTDAGSLAELARRCDTIVSVCPPSEALALARTVADSGFDGIYVDANAVSPMTAEQIAALFDRAVDGGVMGPPATAAGTTRMYLSGDDAHDIARRWDGSLLDVRPIDGGIGAASALKMVFAGWTKGTSALLLAVNAVATSFGVVDALHDEWAISLPDLPRRSDRTAGGVAPKAWRFEGEMNEIAATFESAGLPDGFHLAAADVYRRLSDLRHADATPDVDAVVAALLDE